MILTEDEVALLDDVADDWYGIWEANWWFNYVHSDWSWERRAAYLVDLVERELLEVFSRPAHDALLKREAALEVLQSPLNWAVPPEDDQQAFRVATSQTGLAALRAAGLQGI